MPNLSPEDLVAKIQAAGDPAAGLQVLKDEGYALAPSGDVKSKSSGGEEGAADADASDEAPSEPTEEEDAPSTKLTGIALIRSLRNKAVDKAMPRANDEEEEGE